ncbi:Interleukin-36 alpha [Tupaia chinensis]|uniref:Interleukin-1 n=1 Tax=Tupaia chinensis TaxID=246437 RepID=L9JLY3_TUPCH|nr:Interleukin-36 alpha [Tupaia chinensis]
MPRNGKDAQESTKNWRRGCSVPSFLPICIFTFCIELARIQPLVGDIQDSSHRVWVLQGKTLTAVPRKQHTVPVTITLIPCKNLETLEKDRGNPIYLGLKEPELCLSCRKVGEQPMLQLMEQNIMDLHNQSNPVLPFLFYHNRSGSISTFESVAFPRWFLSAGSKGECPLILTQELGTINTTEFQLTILK